jgi:hypothetical protein
MSCERGDRKFDREWRLKPPFFVVVGGDTNHGFMWWSMETPTTAFLPWLVSFMPWLVETPTS